MEIKIATENLNIHTTWYLLWRLNEFMYVTCLEHNWHVGASLRFVGSFSSFLICFTCQVRRKQLLLCECGRLSNPKPHFVALWLLTFLKLYHPLNFQQVITLQGEDLLEEAAGTSAFRHQVHAEWGCLPSTEQTLKEAVGSMMVATSFCLLLLLIFKMHSCCRKWPDSIGHQMAEWQRS